MENNENKSKLRWVYLTGFCVILSLPLLTIQPWFYPPDFGKSVIFRSLLAIMLFLFIWSRLQSNRGSSTQSGQILYKNKIVWAAIAFFIVYLLATIFSVDPNFSLWGNPYRGGGFITFAFYFVFAGLAFLVLKKEDWQKAWTFSIFIGVLVSFFALIQSYGIFSNIFAPQVRPGATTGNPIILGIYLLLLFFPTLAFAIKAKNIYLKIFYILSLLLFLYTIIITGSRAAYIGIAIGIICFLLLYPKKLISLKILVGFFLIFIALTVFYVNTATHFPQILENNKAFKMIQARSSLKMAFTDERFRAWKTVAKEIKNRPFLGWGPENLATGFDKNYDPSVTQAPWWDKAHNMILQTGAEAGILGIISYLCLFVILFWQLQKHKKNSDSPVIICGLQAVLIGYFTANFFSFDGFPTYLIFFLVIACSLHLTTQNGVPEVSQKREKQKTTSWKTAVTIILFLILIIFIWQYNIVPLQINKGLNDAGVLADNEQCDAALSLTEKILQQHSFLDSYARMEYAEFVKNCSDYYPDKSLEYLKQGVEKIKEAVKIQPLYTRYWLFLGSSTNILAAHEKNPETKTDLLKQVSYYLDKALQLAPKHLDILIEPIKEEMIIGNYKKMQDYSNKCIALAPEAPNCYWYLALSDICLKDNANAQKNMQTAANKGYNTKSITSLTQLSDAYGAVLDYQNLTVVYEKLIVVKPKNAQYHSSLAFFYKNLGEYSKAREQALIVLQLLPDEKQSVDNFLSTLP